MNPITEHRYYTVRYVVLYTLFAALYAVVFGVAAHLEAWYAVLDGAVFGIVSGFEGLILWNVLRYGATGITKPPLRTAFHLVIGILFVAVAVGAETVAVWAAGAEAGTATDAAEMFPAFATTIPARCLVAAAVYACFVLWYSYAALCDDRKGVENADARGIARTAGMRETGIHDAGMAEVEAPGALSGKGQPSEPGAQNPPVEPLERITVRGSQGKIEIIDTRDVIYFGAEGDYVSIVTAKGRWLKEQTLKYFEDVLPRGEFVRVHRSYIVSVSHISRIESSGRERSVVLRGLGSGGNRAGSGAGSGNIRNSGGVASASGNGGGNGGNGGGDNSGSRNGSGNRALSGNGGGNGHGNGVGGASIGRTIRISDAGYKLLRRTLGL